MNSRRSTTILSKHSLSLHFGATIGRTAFNTLADATLQTWRFDEQNRTIGTDPWCMDHAINLTSPNDVAISRLQTSIGRRQSLQSQMKNTFFSPAGQGLIASNTHRPVQCSRGHLGTLGDTALDTAHKTELNTLGKPSKNQSNGAHFVSRRTKNNEGPEKKPTPF